MNLDLVKLGHTNFLAPCEEVIWCHYFNILLVFKVLEYVDHVFATKGISYSEALLSETLDNHIENLFSYVEHVFFCDLLVILVLILIIVVLILVFSIGVFLFRILC